jgi:hypothetical protein
MAPPSASRQGEQFAVPFLENAKRLVALHTAPLDRSLAEQLRGAFDSLPDPTFGALVAAVRHDRAAVLGALWRMIARGELHADLTVLIGFQIRLALP